MPQFRIVMNLYDPEVDAYALKRLSNTINLGEPIQESSGPPVAGWLNAPSNPSSDPQRQKDHLFEDYKLNMIVVAEPKHVAAEVLIVNVGFSAASERSVCTGK